MVKWESVIITLRKFFKDSNARTSVLVHFDTLNYAALFCGVGSTNLKIHFSLHRSFTIASLPANLHPFPARPDKTSYGVWVASK
jgi:hypothetical protein